MIARIGVLSALLSLILGTALTWLPVMIGSAEANTLDAVRARGHVVCGVSEDAAGFSTVGRNGAWTGLEIDFCGAVAAAVLGSRDAIKFRPLSPIDRFQALKAGDVDLLSRAATWTLSRDTELGVRYTDTIFYDGQGFMVRRGYAVASVLELSGASICALGGTSAETAVSHYFRSRQMKFELVTSKRWEDVVKSYADGACTILTGDISVLAYERSRLAAPSDHMIMSEIITKEPYAPVVRQGDEQWFSIVRWTFYALVAGEELGLTSENIEGEQSSQLIDVRRFLGLEGNLGQGMGLERGWSFQIVRQVGNYGEMFERNLGSKSALRLDRGLNNLWTKGGMMYVPPLR